MESVPAPERNGDEFSDCIDRALEQEESDPCVDMALEQDGKWRAR